MTRYSKQLSIMTVFLPNLMLFYISDVNINNLLIEVTYEEKDNQHEAFT